MDSAKMHAAHSAWRSLGEHSRASALPSLDGESSSLCVRRDRAWHETAHASTSARDSPHGAVGNARLLRLDGRSIAVFPGDRGVCERDKVALVVGSVNSGGNVAWTAAMVAV